MGIIGASEAKLLSLGGVKTGSSGAWWLGRTSCQCYGPIPNL